MLCWAAVTHRTPPHLVSRKRWGEVVTMEVSASVDVCQPDRLTTSDGSSPLTHCGCLPSYPPVTVAVIHRGYTCHRLLPTTWSVAHVVWVQSHVVARIEQLHHRTARNDSQIGRSHSTPQAPEQQQRHHSHPGCSAEPLISEETPPLPGSGSCKRNHREEKRKKP